MPRIPMLPLRTFVITSLAVLVLSLGTYLAGSQHRKITSWQEVEAEVVSADLERHSGGGKVSYEPKVVYRYLVDGITHESSHVTPISFASTQRWARDIVHQFSPGQKTIAYYNPADPSEAFLLRRYEVFPYVVVSWAILFFAMAIETFCTRARKPRMPLPAPGGWFALRIEKSSGMLQRMWMSIAIVGLAGGMLAYGHFFSVASRPYGTMAIVAPAIHGAICLIPVGLAGYHKRMRRKMDDPMILIDRLRLVCGGQVKVRIEQRPRQQLQVEEIRIGLICDKTIRTRTFKQTTISTSACHEEWETVLENATVRGGEVVSGEYLFTIPAIAEATSPFFQKHYPRYAWRLTMNTRLAASRDYRLDWPVLVLPATPVTIDAQAADLPMRS